MGDAPHGPLVFGVPDGGGGGGGITGIDVQDTGVDKATNVQILNFVPDGSVLMEISEPVNGVAAIEIAVPSAVFGQDYKQANTPQEIQTNNAAWTDVAQMANLMVGGIYRLGWSTEVDSNGTFIGVRVLHTPGMGPPVVLAMGEITAGALHDPHGGIVTDLVLDAGAQTFTVQIQSGGPPVTVGARRTRIEIWKVANP